MKNARYNGVATGGLVVLRAQDGSNMSISVAQTETNSKALSPERDADDGLRTAASYLAGLKGDGRQVFIDGEAVRDVTTHPGFRGAARSMAGLWDIAADPAN